MSNNHRKIFIDSSILVEFEKQTKTDLLLQLMSDKALNLFVNCTVLSEYTYYLLAIEGGKSPRAIKEDENIGAILIRNNPEPFLSTFQMVALRPEVTTTFLEMMSKYNLLPNDALILADCKLNSIDTLATYDIEDFSLACDQEGIQLVSSISDLSLS
ncbi:putative nucleic acid-binding protein [Dyadobacter sp. BE34]|uniref:Nucleic acid-binding protein n=1 Tax=Dyadobacter fermentans TaxID=94254 RepID=A0ABU1R3C4_9BACT|nr:MULTISPECIES: PIN domain-containing protein [Dyadobacter]MDR6807911.1 putative nucleic acid-binding protein [Dyadobacter fermentans]MDR7045652.1 putative nucleic acid-binding protein [Dyadobacter sp. BE242]MDR7199965.1 putative nucleic acid-binding protein [Dyadobacter sp. BE34]MDR7217576.1 putative nucleic acid-binding protein [Dyadobacter sp. BE31]MDR7265856.1 putative nucleic acid-binding protein [Dyadobacter sp. BE32]